MQKQSTHMRVTLALALVFALALTVMPLSTQEAHAQKFPAYTSGVQVQNLEATQASVTLKAYKDDGTVAATIGPDIIPANGSKTYFPLAVPQGFQGSMVIESGNKVAAIANVLSSDFGAGGSYLAASAGATTVQLPLLFKNNSGFSTWYAVQNAGSADSNCKVDYSSAAPDATFTLKPSAAKVVYQDQENHNIAIFSGIVTCSQPAVAAVIQESSDVLFAYTGFTGGATNPVMPLINANNSGYVTGVQIQNAGTQATAVTVSYTPVSGNGTACTETQTIQPGVSNTFALTAFAPGESAGESSNCADGVKFIGSAKVTANSTNQPLAAIVNQLLPGTNGEAYGSFDTGAATDTVVMPLILDRRGGFFTGFNIQNVGSQATTVNCKFSDSSYTVGSTLQPGGALNDLQGNKIANNYAGSGTCIATGGDAKIVGVVNELGSTPGADQLLVYEGANP
jgi:hypothetical protein